MHFVRTLKTSAIAALLVIGTAGASMAATAWMEKGSNVRANHNPGAPVVNHVAKHEKVNVVGSWGQWYKVKIPGQDGWVRKNRVTFDNPNGWGNGWGPGWGNGGSFCINGEKAQFCISGNN